MDEQKETKLYRLYSLRPTSDNIEMASGERFHRITPGYILIYTQSEQPDKSVEITIKEAAALTAYDKTWLRDCVKILLIEAVTSEPNENRVIDMLLKVEQALAAESERYRQEAEAEEE